MSAHEIIEVEVSQQSPAGGWLSEPWRVARPHDTGAFEIVPDSSYKGNTRWFQDSIAIVQYKELADHIVAVHNASLTAQ